MYSLKSESPVPGLIAAAVIVLTTVASLIVVAHA